ncbi:hypothetical protein KY284_001389 [Solanum tuberosum]|nr:hypothetical protein KY284_001389 [Solanum tuberosum]
MKGKDQMKSSHSCIPSASSQILQKCCIRGNQKGKHDCDLPCSFSSESHVLSTVKIFEMAQVQLLHHTSKKEDDPSIASQPLNSHSDLSLEVSDDLQLALLLQASAEMFSKRHYEHATELLSLCNLSASLTGTPVQRVVYYYSEALQERIDKETKSITGLQLDRLVDYEVKPAGVEELFLCSKPHVIACYHALPFYQVTQFACIQAILDNVKSEKRLHLIDFGIRSGSHWTILMQALANRGDCPLELLKITAIGTSKQVVDETGKRLSSFAAENMKFPFFFKAVVSEMKDLSKDLFELDTNEVVVVYSEYILGGMLAWPNHLEVVLRFIKNLNPCVIVVIETEANTNEPIFMDRFNGSVFLYAALFDCLEAFMEQDNQHRMEFERLVLREVIHNVITCEGEGRIFRNVRLEVWRALFEKFGIKETELSESSLYQANLMADRSAHGFCTLDMDGNCLTIKWKGTPIVFASAWKFVHD